MNNSFDLSLLKKVTSFDQEQELKAHERELLYLCGELKELNEISQQFNIMVNSQHEQLNIIENNINDTAAKTESGVNELEKAKSYYYVSLKYGLLAGLILMNTPIAILYSTKFAAITASTSLVAAYFVI